MSNNTPQIVLFETDPYYKINLDLILSSVGIEIGPTGSQASEINELVKKIESGELNPDIVIISNFLIHGWDDGEKVATRIRNANKQIKIISYSIIKDKPIWSDEHAIKSGLDNEATIINALKKLLNVGINFDNKDRYD